MKLAFLIDKPQTLQTVVGVVNAAINRDYSCVIFSTHPMGFNDTGLVSNRVVSDRRALLKTLIGEKDEFDAIIGINLFNTIWKDFYDNAGSNVFALEYCWNEVYNSRKLAASSATLYANSDWTAEKIKALSTYDNVVSIGSPWFDMISNTFKVPWEEREKKPYIVFMAPHNSFLNTSKEFFNDAMKAMSAARDLCDQLNVELVLKTRQKYSIDYTKSGIFDAVVTDTAPFDHLALYGGSICTLNFCSSAINELTFLNVPSICLLPEYHIKLHSTHNVIKRAVKELNARYYSGDIFNGQTCAKLEASEISQLSNNVSRFSDMIDKAKDVGVWDDFQATYFPGNHHDASNRVLDDIEKRISS